jgi:hypothetical protein
LGHLFSWFLKRKEAQMKGKQIMRVNLLLPSQLLMLIGTADVLAAPTEKPVFIEDLAPEAMQVNGSITSCKGEYAERLV